VNQLRALLVGAGTMGQAWARNLRDCADVQTAGWMDILPGAAAAAIDKHHFTGIQPFDDLPKALADLRPDFVVDVTVPEAHRDVTLAALSAGVAVLGEKPLAHSMAAAREMVAASEKSGKLYMVSQSRRYDAKAIAFKSLIAEHVGQLGILDSDFYLGPHFGGFRDQMASVLLLDMAIHTFDTARHLSGADPLSVYCEEFNPAWSWFKGDCSAVALFEMAGGLRYSYRASWCAQGLGTSWNSQWRACGSKGSAIWDGDNAPVAEVVAGGGGLIPESKRVAGMVQENIHGGIAGSLREFVDSLKSGRIPQGECHDNIKSLSMVFAALESAHTKRRVPIHI
jgi:predicted dehydrogenase